MKQQRAVFKYVCVCVCRVWIQMRAVTIRVQNVSLHQPHLSGLETLT